MGHRAWWTGWLASAGLLFACYLIIRFAPEMMSVITIAGPVALALHQSTGPVDHIFKRKGRP